MKYYMTNSNFEIIRKFEEEEFTVFLENLLYQFNNSIKSKYEYNITNFIKYFYKNYFVSGKETIDSYTIEFCEDSKSFVKPITYLKDNLFILVEAKSNTDFKILNAESIFFNYSPKENVINRKFNFRFYGDFDRSYTSRYYHPGNGRRTAVYDTKIDEAEKYCKENGYRLLKARRRIYVNPWEEDLPKNKHTKSWKETTKRRRQFKAA